MTWLDEVLQELAAARQWGYHRAQPTAAEPAALAAIALHVNGLPNASARPIQWLIDHQAMDGSVGVTSSQATPGWPTSLAILAWHQAGINGDRTRRGIDWLLSTSGKALEHHESMGHDTTLIGWPWVVGTHSWLEPTAFAVTALKRTGYADHPRAREAVRLIIDRLLPDGGANYGNTVVLDQRLRPHVQPSGIALLAVADENDPTGRVRRTTDYLRGVLSDSTTTASLCFGLLGLGISQQLPEQNRFWLERAALRTLEQERSPYKLALLAIAAKADSLFSP